MRVLPVVEAPAAEQLDLAAAGFGAETAPVWRIA
jgi:hypothetical protein